MNSDSLVSAVVIFLNAERYLQEAVESILAQTYPHWELLLVDDGSSDDSSEIARRYAQQSPNRVRYLAHPGHVNRGKGASRNLGIREAQGRYVAFLDADDIWLPHKLGEQVAILDAHEEAGMLYGETLYWYSWTEVPEDKKRDFVPALGVPTGVPIQPPRLLTLFLRGKAAVPCPCSVLVKRSIVTAIDGFDESFTGISNIYEDQAFYAKICLHTPVVASNNCWDLYRQHSQSSMAHAREAGQEIAARKAFLQWLDQYLKEQDVQDEPVWQALRREQWRLRHPSWLPDGARVQNRARWAKKWLLQAEERLMPAIVSRRLWGDTPL
jgi:glycosyltransferase involved in cell wall biosynthesis